VGVSTESLNENTGGRSVDEPCSSRRTEHGSVELAVAVIVARYRNITIRSERECKEREVFASQDEPLARRRSPEGNVRLAVAGVVARDSLVRRCPELERKQTGRRTLDPPFGCSGCRS